MTTNRGGRITPDGRPPQAKGIGKNAKRHDLERQKTPGLHGSDLQQGDIQALEQGQRIAPAQRQEAASGVSVNTNKTSQSVDASSQSVEVPDAIQFLGQRAQGAQVPETSRVIRNDRALSWMPILRQLASGPGASGQLASAFINQARELGRSGATPATIIDLNAIDDGMEAMLDEF